MIPYKFHLIWIGRQFPFVNRLAVESISQTNPQAEIIIHFLDPPSDNKDWDALASKAQFRSLDIRGLIKSYSQDTNTQEAVLKAYETVASSYPAGRSNILRYLILYKEGGIYADFDTITIGNFEPLLEHKGFIGEESVFKCDDDRVLGKIGPSIIPYGAAFGLSYYGSLFNCRYLNNSEAWNHINRLLMKFCSAKKLNNAMISCEPGSPFIKKALELVPLTDPGIKFSLGPMLLNKVWDNGNQSEITRLLSDYFYLIPPSQTFRFFHGPPPPIPETSFSLHWCFSNHKKYAGALTRSQLEKPRQKPTLFQLLAKRVIDRMDE
jgi:hypothetical protein